MIGHGLSGRVEQFPGQTPADPYHVWLSEIMRAGFLTEQNLVEGLEPVAQRLEVVLFSNRIDFSLNGLGVGDVFR